MYEFISGKIAQTTPAYVVLENNGIGYLINISLNTYEALKGKNESSLYIYENIREDAYILYGFAGTREREIFQLLISVSGIGANTARMMLSSMTPDELQAAIATENVNQIKSIKGIGLKTAQRVIVELKDKIGKTTGGQKLAVPEDNTNAEEALSALVMLGFSKGPSQKVVDKILREKPGSKVEEIIKLALKIL
ncbi:MAG: Holliday junction branch migration protein RuvA [Anaerophaga sp.]|jgi:Holliday junction DNA helicase RuvA|uniref:Holliday junction branch migration protein RuvA n=1 Tax=Anaerophaga thermohalophila TaxID=177400 RepID=UPI000237C29A|nr:Holliday junction branch migration protein RuvA [Anaerophaga thermohalophila]MBZ4675853.1 Holliday junction branch migration protein RuvA [Anaerophaga sp.]MDI3521637.1 holliday junction helicase RuvA [Anaerophaga sp.]MDK2840496.1 holliday junction helicase RuvA [Anaerophaga sp.]MDN5290125.1 holliday junction helicase RuvA [Anaerophaga sp.]